MLDYIPHGALDDTRSPEEKAKDHFHEDLYSGLPVTWVEKSMTSWITTTQRNQDGSFSCVKQSSATAIETLTKQIISAATYQLRSNKPGEGMFLQNCGDIDYNQGATFESVCPSQNINDAALDSITLPPVLNIKIKGYRTFQTFEIDQIAEAVQAYGNCILVFNSNTDEWKRTPEYLGTPITFGHAICATDFTLINGVKTLVCMDSAGQFSSPTGLRLITEDFLSKRCKGAMYYIGATIGQEQPSSFNIDLKYGDIGPEVIKLQQFLIKQGYFKGTPTGFYGDITRQAVYNFQLQNVILTPYENLFLRGKIFGPKSRLVANQMIHG